MKLVGKRILIIGGGSGIGLELASEVTSRLRVVRTAARIFTRRFSSIPFS